MNDGWRLISLKDAGISLIDCEHRTPPPSAVGYPYVAIPQLKDGRLDLSDVRYISRIHFTEWTRKARPQQFDVILSRRCNPGETAYVPPGLECALGQNLVLLRADGSVVYPPFLRWLVRGSEWWQQVRNHLNVGAVFDSLKCADIPNFKLHIPPLEEQRSISFFLGALDDKIALNRKMSETLEEMARAIFKAWFIDFEPVRAKIEGRWHRGQSLPGLPAAMYGLWADSFIDVAASGTIPQGWSVVPLKQLAGTISKGTTPTKAVLLEAQDSPSIPFLKVKDLTDEGKINRANLELIPRSVHETILKRSILQEGDILFSMAGTLGRVAVIDASLSDCNTNQAIAFIRLNDLSKHFGLCLMHLKSPRIQQHTQTMAVHAVQANVSLESIGNFSIVLPPDPLLAEWNKLFNALHHRLVLLDRESRTLIAIRDAFLPKLINGEIRVKEAENLVGSLL
ncbi:MAG: restriction endonuclease subunit S [Candidatus Melainabacteria bacterium]|nr:restriction endonuclease subunit S [Candidatus Melainabacteria bacterium]